MQLIRLLSLMLMGYTLSAQALNEHNITHHQLTQPQPKNHPLIEAGNDIFAALQEVISALNADPKTDWSEVNLTALKEHLLDMRDMVINVELVSKKALKNGSEILIKPTNKRARQAMKRVLSGHPAQLKQETGWNMSVTKQTDTYLLTTTTENQAEVSKIIGLGYIGLMAHGSHHQPHHWSMATGSNPHLH